MKRRDFVKLTSLSALLPSIWIGNGESIPTIKFDGINLISNEDELFDGIEYEIDPLIVKPLLKTRQTLAYLPKEYAGIYCLDKNSLCYGLVMLYDRKNLIYPEQNSHVNIHKTCQTISEIAPENSGVSFMSGGGYWIPERPTNPSKNIKLNRGILYNCNELMTEAVHHNLFGSNPSTKLALGWLLREHSYKGPFNEPMYYGEVVIMESIDKFTNKKSYQIITGTNRNDVRWNPWKNTDPRSETRNPPTSGMLCDFGTGVDFKIPKIQDKLRKLGMLLYN